MAVHLLRLHAGTSAFEYPAGHIVARSARERSEVGGMIATLIEQARDRMRERQREKRSREAAIVIMRELSESWGFMADSLSQIAIDIGADSDMSAFRDEANRCQRFAQELEKRGKIGKKNPRPHKTNQP